MVALLNEEFLEEAKKRNAKLPFDSDYAIRIRLMSPWLAKLTFNQSLGMDISSRELRMRTTHSRYKQLVSNLQLQSRVRSMPPSRPQINATTGGLSAAITDTVKLPVSTMVNNIRVT